QAEFHAARISSTQASEPNERRSFSSEAQWRCAGTTATSPPCVQEGTWGADWYGELRPREGDRVRDRQASLQRVHRDAPRSAARRDHHVVVEHEPVPDRRLDAAARRHPALRSHGIRTLVVWASALRVIERSSAGTAAPSSTPPSRCCRWG